MNQISLKEELIFITLDKIFNEIGIFMLNDKKNITSLEVFNMMGELVLSQGNAKQINLQAFPKGIYIARINGMQVCRLVKE